MKGFSRQLIKGTVTACLIVLIAISGLLAQSSSSSDSADDGAMMRKVIADTPDLESEGAQLSMMQFYVPATRASGLLVAEDDKNPTPSGQIEYWGDDPNIDGNAGEKDYLAFTRGYAKPLVITYWDEIPPEKQDRSGVHVGLEWQRDAFAAVSLDDGETWKERNLSESALQSSFQLDAGEDFPGDVIQIVHAVAGNKILVAWTSKYCDQGSPRYSLADIDGDGIPDQNVGQDDNAVPLYPDPFGVGGNQGSIDYTTFMHQGEYPFSEVGQIPFSCLWTARGTIQQVPDPQTGEPEWGVLWRKAERLTSGKRDAHYLAIDGVEGAGFSLVWQEDPEGLRPGFGEGPGIGWSGATVNHKTDMWYSHIGWGSFDTVQDQEGNPITNTLDIPTLIALETNNPKVYERMAMPSRISDNEKCEVDDLNGSPKRNDEGEVINPYCYDLDLGNGVPDGAPDGVGDLCPLVKNDGGTPETSVDDTYTVADASRIIAWQNSQGETKYVCVSDDGRLLNGQTGSSRTRMMMEGYTNAEGVKSAWVVMAYEETKGLGAGHPENPGQGSDDEEDDALDIGKDVMYHSFDMSIPDQAAAGHMLNMPETDLLSLDSENPTFLDPIPNDLSVALNGGTVETAPPNQYQTTIGRRPSMLVQPGAKIRAAYEAGQTVGMTSAIVLYKDGFERQGGPSDIFMRRFVIPEGFDPTVDNPYAVENITCTIWDTAPTDDFRDFRSEFPNLAATYPPTSYPNGVCMRGAVNLSGTNPLTFEDLGNWTDSNGNGQPDPDDDLPSHGITQRVLTWEQTAEDLGDEQWENKYEVAKGHRGFIDGDFVVIMYAHSPNWLATSYGHEPYNLYLRRSFDGGVTWTTTPATTIQVDLDGDGVAAETVLVDIDRDGVTDDLGGDGTFYVQEFSVGERVWTISRDLAAGEYEPARNVSQIIKSKDTVLDPRYSPTNIGTQSDVTRTLQIDGAFVDLATLVGAEIVNYDNERDPSEYFVVYETGVNEKEAEGEAAPEDLFYSRATHWGDDYDTVLVYAQGRDEEEERWDWLENKDEDISGEASMAASPGGDFMYVVWNQWCETEEGEAYDSDPVYRRLWWDPDALEVEAGAYVVDDGEVVMLVATATDPQGGEIVSYVWDLDADGSFESAGKEMSFQATTDGARPLVKACNVAGICGVDRANLVFANQPPTIVGGSGGGRRFRVKQETAIEVLFEDAGRLDTHTAIWDWGDDSVSLGMVSKSQESTISVTGSHIYESPGIYTITVVVTDCDGDVGTATLRATVDSGQLYLPMVGNE